MNGITNLHGMNKKHEETNYCAFDDKLTYLEIQVRAGSVMMADAQTDYLFD